MKDFFKTLNTAHFPFKFSEDELLLLLEKTAFDIFKESGFLELSSPLKEILCPECGEHSSEIKIEDGQIYGVCQKPDIGRFYVNVDEIRVWQFNIKTLFDFLIENLRMTHDFQSMIEDKLWKIGKTNNNTYVFYSKTNDIAYLKDFIEALNISQVNCVVFTNSPAKPLKIKNGQILCIPLSDILKTGKKRMICDSKEFNRLLDIGFNKVIFDQNNGELIVVGETVVSVTPATKEYYFLELLFLNFNYPVPYDNILTYCSEKTGVNYEDRAQVFCQKVKSELKGKSENKEIVDKIIKPSKTKEGLTAYQMKNPE
ncbi:hypothetical protein ACFL3M_03805 [Patescibacteria group bacterium]